MCNSFCSLIYPLKTFLSSSFKTSLSRASSVGLCFNLYLYFLEFWEIFSCFLTSFSGMPIIRMLVLWFSFLFYFRSAYILSPFWEMLPLYFLILLLSFFYSWRSNFNIQVGFCCCSGCAPAIVSWSGFTRAVSSPCHQRVIRRHLRFLFPSLSLLPPRCLFPFEFWVLFCFALCLLYSKVWWLPLVCSRVRVDGTLKYLWKILTKRITGLGISLGGIIISRNFLFDYPHSPEMNDSSGVHPGGFKSSCQTPGIQWEKEGGGLNGQHIYILLILHIDR